MTFIHFTMLLQLLSFMNYCGLFLPTLQSHFLGAMFEAFKKSFFFKKEKKKKLPL